LLNNPLNPETPSTEILWPFPFKTQLPVALVNKVLAEVRVKSEVRVITTGVELDTLPTIENGPLATSVCERLVEIEIVVI
jgi:hypothetical protein